MVQVETSELVTYRGVFVDSKKYDMLTINPERGQRWIETGEYVDKKTGEVYPFREVITVTETLKVWKREDLVGKVVE